MTSLPDLTVGVLGMQGDVRPHVQMLDAIGVEAETIRHPEDLKDVNCLIMPGGESTTISKMLNANRMLRPLSNKIYSGMPTWGTCAGMILLSRESEGGREEVHPFSVLDIAVERNAYGRQTSSFEVDLAIAAIGEPDFTAVFIRSPMVTDVGEGVEVLASYDNKPVFCRQGNVFACSFHPELTEDDRLHRYFLKEAAECLDIQNGPQ